MDCMSCFYWLKNKEQIKGEADLGRCKRYPPQVFAESPIIQYELFPLTDEGNSCGEWRDGIGVQ